MSKDRPITQEHFDSLLSWLDVDREQAGTKYEELRRTLIKIFIWRGFPEAEDLADETINRVARRVQDLAPTYTGNPSLYFYGVANNLLKEMARKKRLQVPLDQTRQIVSQLDPPESSDRLDCLGKCLDQLRTDHRQLFLMYYDPRERSRVGHRREIAERLDMEPNALRVRMYRTRAALERCISNCVKHYSEEYTNKR